MKLTMLLIWAFLAIAGCTTDLELSTSADEICTVYACGSDGQNCSYFPQGCGGDGNGGGGTGSGGGDTGGGGAGNWACQTQTNCHMEIHSGLGSPYQCYNTGETVSACWGHQMYVCAVVQEKIMAQYCNGALCSAVPFLDTQSGDLCSNQVSYGWTCSGYTTGMDACSHAAPIAIDPPPPPPPILPPGDGGGPCQGSRCPVEQGSPVQDL